MAQAHDPVKYQWVKIDGHRCDLKWWYTDRIDLIQTCRILEEDDTLRVLLANGQTVWVRRK